MLSVSFFLLAVSLTAQDLDHDGLKDRFEQDLLQRFLPTFQVSGAECDGSPAEFERDRVSPRPVARNGTVYGRDATSKQGVNHLEIQYFHLWVRDCGPFSHALDVKHVSALLTASNRNQPARKWKAVSRYAAAHEGTLCDNSGRIRANELKAESKGPIVWISKGKHASYLDLRQCALGCRTDVCTNSQTMQVTRVINLGEPDAPLNGSLFVQSRRWKFREKLLRSDFQLIQ